MAENNIPVSREAHAANIRELQIYLRRLHYSGENVRRVIPDGIYGANTRGAVGDVQRMKGIPETGETDLITWNSVYESSAAVNGGAYGIYAFPSADTVFSSGDSGTSVVILQAMLNTLAGEYENIPPAAVSGRYDSSTERSVRAVQELSGLPATGRTDISAWNTIVTLFNGIAEE